MSNFPVFIGIGAQRSGSTWLYENLRIHPEISLSPVKELHYFDGKGFGVPGGVWKKFFTTQWPHKRFRRLLLSRLKAKLSSCKTKDWLWDYRFFFKPQSDQWYASLFDEGVGKCTGEITPAYALLESSQISEIHSLMPDTKIIFLLRNPVDRAWSQAVKEFSKDQKRPLESIGDAEWEATLSHKRVLLRSDYLRTLELWSEFYPEQNIFVGFFDDIKERPRELLTKIHRFLDVESSEAMLPPDLSVAVNSGKGGAIPQRWERYLSEQYLHQISMLNTRFGGPAFHWLARAKAAL